MLFWGGVVHIKICVELQICAVFFFSHTLLNPRPLRLLPDLQGAGIAPVADLVILALVLRNLWWLGCTVLWLLVEVQPAKEKGCRSQSSAGASGARKDRHRQRNGVLCKLVEVLCARGDGEPSAGRAVSRGGW